MRQKRKCSKSWYERLVARLERATKEHPKSYGILDINTLRVVFVTKSRRKFWVERKKWSKMNVTHIAFYPQRPNRMFVTCLASASIATIP